MWECRTIARSPAGSGMADREEVESAVEVCLVLAPQGEVRGRDRGHEPVVEGLRDAQRRVNPVPPHPDRQLVQAELAGVMEAEQLDRREVGRQQLPVLAGGVLAQVPWVTRALGTG